MQNKTDGYYVKAKLDEATGVYYVTSHVTDKKDATRFVPTVKDGKGKILIKGLEDDEYTVTEIKTADGYTLLKKGISVVISRKDASASAAVDGKQAAMLADNGSANALVPLSVVNTSGFDLPATGDRGVWMYGLAGILLMTARKPFRGSAMSGRKNVKRGHWQILLAAVLFLLALGLTLYPVVSNWYIGRHQSRIQTEYREVLEQTDSAEIESIRESAAAYNKTITPGAAEEAYSQASMRFKNMKPDMVFSAINEARKRMSEKGFETHRLTKPELKRFLAIYLEASMDGDKLPDMDGSQYIREALKKDEKKRGA